MIRFTTILKKFGSQGEKTGWTYIEVLPDQAVKLKQGNKKEFKVKGKLDSFLLKRVSLLPVGGGAFIMPVNAQMRKAIGKRKGAMVKVQLEEDQSEFIFNEELMLCLADEPAAEKFFNSLPGSHQRYFSKWIDSAKTAATRAKRIALAVNALAKKLGYQEMMRAQRTEKEAWNQRP